MDLEEIDLLHDVQVIAIFVLSAYYDRSVFLRAHDRHELSWRRYIDLEYFPRILSQIVHLDHVAEVAILSPPSSHDDLELVDGTGCRVLLGEDHGADVLPLLRHDVVARACLLQLLLFATEAAKHIDEALVVAHRLVLKVFVRGAGPLLQHQLILVVEKEDVWSIYQEY